MKLEPYDNPALKVAAERAVLARAATDVDDPVDVLTAGIDFAYLGQAPSGHLVRGLGVPDTAPDRIVIDVDSFLKGMTGRDGFTWLAITTGGSVLQVEMPQGRCADPGEVNDDVA